MKSSETWPGMWRARSDRKMNAPLSTATTCRSSGMVAADLRAPFRRRAFESAPRRAGFQSDAARPWAQNHTSMKKFEIITESDARVLAPGETVMLARGGHVTPLAQDTLKERRVTVVHEGRASRRGRPRWRRRRTSGRSRSPATTPA